MQLRHAIAASFCALALALGGCGDGDDDAGNPESAISLEEAKEPLTDGPAGLRAIRSEANQLLGGEEAALRERLDSLRGTPVVVNNWASWCGPCRAEFPLFQQVALDRGGEIAFLGVDSDDSNAAAETFLGELPLPYPSYEDPNYDLRREFLDNAVGLPATAFYDAGGELAYVHQGPYESADQLTAEIERYAR